MAENTPRSLFDDNSAASLKQPPVVVNSPTPDVSQDKSEWLISEDDSILQVIRDQQGLPLSLTTLKPGHVPNWDLAADAVNSVTRVYKSARNCKARFKNVLLLSKEGNNVRATTNHLYKKDRNASYTTIFRKRCKEIAELAQKRKAQAESVRIQNQQQKVQLTTAQILAQAQLQQVQPQQVSITGGTGTVVKTGSAPSSGSIPISAVTMGSININVSLPQGKSGVQTKGATTITNQQSRQLQLQQQLLNQVKKGSKVTTNLTQLAKGKSGVQTKGSTTITNQQSRQLQLQQQLLNQVKKGSKVTTNLTQLAKLNTAQILAQAQLQQVQPRQVSITGGTRTVVKTGSAPSSVAIPISAVTMGSVNINVSLPQGKSGVQTKGATTITNQQSRQLQLQQQLLNQAKKGNKVPKRGSMMTAAFISVPVNSVGNSQQVKGVPTAMTIQPKQQAMKAMPQNLPVVPKRGSMMTAAFISVPVNSVGNSQQVKGVPTAMTIQPKQQAMKAMPQNLPVVSKRGSMMTAAFISAPGNSVGNSQQVKGVPTAMTIQPIQQAMKAMPQNLPVVSKRGSMMTAAFISAPGNSVGNSQQVKGVPTAMTIQPIQQAMKAMPQNLPVVSKRGSMMTAAFISVPGNSVGNSQQVKGVPTAMTIQPIQQAMKAMPQNLPVVPKRGSMMTAAFISAPLNSVGNSQQVKGVPTAMTIQPIQQAMKAMPQNLPVVVTATPSLPGIQHTVTTLCGEPDVVASSVKAQLRNPPK